jgi:hypothetical protein
MKRARSRREPSPKPPTDDKPRKLDADALREVRGGVNAGVIGVDDWQQLQT